MEELIEANKLNEDLKIAQEVEKRKEIERLHKNIEYKDALENQLAELEHRKIQEYEAFIKEKAMVDEIVRKIMDDDER